MISCAPTKLYSTAETMTATADKVTMYAGEKKILRFTVVNKNVSGDPPLDLTSYDVRWSMSRVGDNGYSATPTVKKDTGGVGGVVKTFPLTGICEVTLVRTDTATISLGTYHQELEVVDGSGELAVVAVGDIEVLRNVDNSL